MSPSPQRAEDFWPRLAHVQPFHCVIVYKDGEHGQSRGRRQRLDMTAFLGDVRERNLHRHIVINTHSLRPARPDDGDRSVNYPLCAVSDQPVDPRGLGRHSDLWLLLTTSCISTATILGGSRVSF